MCSIDWSLVINGLSAAASLAAVVVALYIAGKDRRDRRRELAAAAFAQMELVELGAETQGPRCRVRIKNLGREPLVGVKIASAEIHTESGGPFRIPEADLPGEIPVLHGFDATGGRWTYWEIHTVLRNASGEAWRLTPEGDGRVMTSYVVKVRCRNADGQAWLLSSDQKPVLVGPG